LGTHSLRRFRQLRRNGGGLGVVGEVREGLGLGSVGDVRNKE